MNIKNNHIEEFLTYYFDLEVPPEYAVLICGNWGSGKTWFVKHFIEEYKEKSKDRNKTAEKVLFVSLYGIQSLSEINDKLFQQLHPLIGSKPVSLLINSVSSKLGLSFDGDKQPEATLQVTGNTLKEYFLNTKDCILIFDDLERASMDNTSILGFINYFVEHQGNKVIIIAHEDKIAKINPEGKPFADTREKIIGKTFEVTTDVENALAHFITEITDKEIAKIYQDSTNLILDIYRRSEFNNLRSLRQSLLDFERLFKIIPDEAKRESPLIEHLLKLCLIYSFEYRSGNVDVQEFQDLWQKVFSATRWFKENEVKEKGLEKYALIGNKYGQELDYSHVLTGELWQEILCKGVLNKEAIQQSILESHYLSKEREYANWEKLCAAWFLSDEEVDNAYEQLKQEFSDEVITEIGPFLQSVSCLMWFSEHVKHDYPIHDILDKARQYIDNLRAKGLLKDLNSDRPKVFERSGWGGYGFLSNKLEAFHELWNYFDLQLQELVLEEAQQSSDSLLELVERDAMGFYMNLVWGEHHQSKYLEIPILQFIQPKDFVQKFMQLTSKDQDIVSKAFFERYQQPTFNKKLKDELGWLREVKTLIEVEHEKRKGKFSYYFITSVLEENIIPAINKLSQDAHLGQADET